MVHIHAKKRDCEKKQQRNYEHKSAFAERVELELF